MKTRPDAGDDPAVHSSRSNRMRPTHAAFLALLLTLPAHVLADEPPVDPDAITWHPGAADCRAFEWAPLEVQALGERTWALRQNPCAHPEANLLYLLAGSERALLIDSGAVAHAESMPLADTVRGLLPPGPDGATLPLLVAHTHPHRDHRAGDAQFAGRPGAEVVPTDTEGMRAFFGFTDWPDGAADIELGGRQVRALPAPGHHPDHLVFHDAATGLLFTGDFLLPGRLLVDDIAAYQRSAERLAALVEAHEVTRVLGGHVELDLAGRAYPAGASHHPDERPFALAPDHLRALPAALADFNGFHARHPDFQITNPMHNLLAVASAAAVLLGLMGWGLVRAIRRRRARRPR